MILTFLALLILISFVSAIITPNLSTFLETQNSQFSDSFTSQNCTSNNSGDYIDFPKDEKVHSFLPEWWYWMSYVFTEDGTHYQGQLVFVKNHVGKIPTFEISFIFYSPEKNHYISITKDQQAEEIDGKFNFDFEGAKAYNYDEKYYMNATVDEFTLSLDFSPVKSLMLYYEDGREEYHFGGYIDYYCFPRNDVTGTLQIGDQVHQVIGYGYYEHAYGQMGPVIKTGWDWFQMNLDDGTDIIVAIVRLHYYVWVNDKECNTKTYRRNQFKLEVLRTWQSSRTKCQYATAWKLSFEDKEYIIEAIRDDMEFLEKPAVKFAAALKVSGSGTGRGIMENMGICSF